MSKTQHTPGPWRLEHLTVWSSEYRICQLDKCGSNKSHIAQANGQLITAAPELLEALKNASNLLAALVTGDLKEVNADSHALKLCREAIAKAEGHT